MPRTLKTEFERVEDRSRVIWKVIYHFISERCLDGNIQVRLQKYKRRMKSIGFPERTQYIQIKGKYKQLLPEERENIDAIN